MMDDEMEKESQEPSLAYSYNEGVFAFSSVPCTRIW